METESGKTQDFHVIRPPVAPLPERKPTALNINGQLFDCYRFDLYTRPPSHDVYILASVDGDVWWVPKRYLKSAAN